MACHDDWRGSGDVQGQGQFVWYPDNVEQCFERSAQVGNRFFLCRPIANRAHARAELGGSAPDAVLVLLHDVGHVYDTSHRFSITGSALLKPSPG
jgi:hypothetical protein